MTQIIQEQEQIQVLKIVERLYERAVLSRDNNTDEHAKYLNIGAHSYANEYGYLNFGFGRCWGHTTFASAILHRFNDSMYVTKNAAMLENFWRKHVDNWGLPTRKNQCGWISQRNVPIRTGTEYGTLGKCDFKGQTVNPVSVLVLDECKVTKGDALEFIATHIFPHMETPEFPKLIINLGT